MIAMTETGHQLRIIGRELPLQAGQSSRQRHFSSWDMLTTNGHIKSLKAKSDVRSHSYQAGTRQRHEDAEEHLPDRRHPS